MQLFGALVPGQGSAGQPGARLAGGEEVRAAGHDAAALRPLLHRHGGHQLAAARGPARAQQGAGGRGGGGPAAACVQVSASKSSIRRFVITEKAPTRAFS